MKVLYMFPLQQERMCGVYRILNKFYEMNHEKNDLKLNKATVTRGNDMKLAGQRCITTGRKSYFSVRVVVHWNRLPTIVVYSKTLYSFKSRLHKYFRDKSFD